MASAIVLAAFGLALIAAATYLVCRPAIRHRPHHASGPLASRQWPLA